MQNATRLPKLSDEQPLVRVRGTDELPAGGSQLIEPAERYSFRLPRSGSPDSSISERTSEGDGETGFVPPGGDRRRTAFKWGSTTTLGMSGRSPSKRRSFRDVRSSFEPLPVRALHIYLYIY